MIPSRERLRDEAGKAGFNPSLFEKVVRLLDLLGGLQGHPFLKNRWALKGGTALNLFLLDLPRLSVDIDLNYTGALDRETMLAERPKVDQALEAVFGRHGLAVRRRPAADEHAGGKWSLRYESLFGGGGNLEVDLNYLLRSPLWPPEVRDSKAIGGQRATGIPVLDIHELAGGKLAALFSRHAARDLFDAHRLLIQGSIDPPRLRLAFVVYGAMNRKDWRQVKSSDVEFEGNELRDQLLPLLRLKEAETIRSPKAWAETILKECRAKLKLVLPFEAGEREFLKNLLDQGKIVPELLTTDSSLRETLRTHPGLLWKAVNVQEHRKKREGKGSR